MAFLLMAEGYDGFEAGLGCYEDDCSGFSLANNGDCLSWRMRFFNYKVLKV